LAAAEHFVSASDWAYSVVDESILLGLNTDRCRACSAQIESIRKARLAHYRYEGGHIQILGFADVNNPDAKKYGERASDLTLRVEPLNVYDAKGARIETGTTSKPITQRFFVVWTPSGWKVSTSARVLT
jgi:hypothetical protein